MPLENNTPPAKENITGLVLAGGRGQRFNNQDKGLIPYKNTSLAEHAIARLKPQTGNIIVSANRNLKFYQNLNTICIKDSMKNMGPLGGIHAALEIIKTEWLVSIACDTPCFPRNYVQQLAAAVANKNTLIAVARSNNRLQNISILVHRSLFDSLDKFLKAGDRKAQIWLEQNSLTIVDFNQPAHAFYNINIPEDIREIEALDCNE